MHSSVPFQALAAGPHSVAKRLLPNEYGAVYTCNSVYKLLYYSVYDFLQKVVCNFNFNSFFSKTCLEKVVIGVRKIIKIGNPL
jgi:hypothetical protein